MRTITFTLFHCRAPHCKRLADVRVSVPQQAIIRGFLCTKAIYSHHCEDQIHMVIQHYHKEQANATHVRKADIFSIVSPFCIHIFMFLAHCPSTCRHPPTVSTQVTHRRYFRILLSPQQCWKNAKYVLQIDVIMWRQNGLLCLHQNGNRIIDLEENR